MEQLNKQDVNSKDSGFLADFDFEKMNFSALDKGLGFHHNENTLKGKNVSSTYELKNNKMLTSREIKGISVPTLKTDKSLTAPEISMEDAFGRESQKFSVHMEEKTQENEILVTESTLQKVTAAWAVDLILIFISIIAALILFTSATGISFNEFKSFMYREESQVFLSVFFVVFYLLYFSVLDLNSSPGKLLFGTRLISINGDRVTVFKTFVRSVVILISIPLFLLPLIFGLQNKLSGTKSIEEKW